MSYPGHSLGESYPSAEVQSVYSIAPARNNEKKKFSGHLKELSDELLNEFDAVLILYMISAKTLKNYF